MAFVLLFYVILIGPVNFRIVRKRNKPTLALITIPVIATSCAFVLFGIGCLDKGITARLRRVEILEAVGGETNAVGRRYSGLFFTAPSSLTLPFPTRGAARLISANRGPAVVDHGAHPPELRGVQGRLWETAFVAEDRVLDLGGSVELRRSGDRVTQVRNGTRHRLRGVVAFNPLGEMFVVGDIARGAAKMLPDTPQERIDLSNVPWEGSSNYSFERFARGMAVGAEHERALLGAVSVLSGNLNAGIAGNRYVLFAWMEGDASDRPRGFSNDFDLQFLRVVERQDSSSGPALQPVIDSEEEGLQP